MSTTNTILAYLGAAAWLPTIWKFIANYFSEPEIEIFVNNTIEIGYTILGPIIIAPLVVNIENKNTIINYLGIEILSKDNQAKYFFKWTGGTEIVSHIKSEQGNQLIHREISPIIFKLDTSSPIERTVRFQEIDFIKKNKKARQDVISKISYNKKIDLNTWKDLSLTSQEFIDHQELYKNKFFWSVGDYTLIFIIKSPKKFLEKKKKFQFSLTQDNINTLSKNIEKTNIYLKNSINGIEQELNFDWVNSDLNEI